MPVYSLLFFREEDWLQQLFQKPIVLKILLHVKLARFHQHYIKGNLLQQKKSFAGGMTFFKI